MKKSVLLAAAFLLVSAAQAQVCIDTSDFIHWSGNGDVPAASVDVEVDGVLAYVLLEGGLLVVDATDPADPVEAGLLTGLAPNQVDLVLDGDRAYALSWNLVQVIDVSLPATPTLRGSYATTGRLATGDVLGGYLYLIGGDDITVLDVSDPDDPTPVYVDDGPVTEPTPDVWASCAAAGQYGVHAGTVMAQIDMGMGHYETAPYSVITVYDVSDPGAPAEVGSYDCGPYLRVGAMTEVGGTILVALESMVHPLDLSDPANPALGPAVNVPGLESRITDASLRGDALWLASEAHGLGVMDVTDPAAPVAVRRYQCPGENQRLADPGDAFYVTTGDDVVALIDLGLEDLSADVANIGVEIPTAGRNVNLVAADQSLGFFIDDAGLLSSVDLSVSGLPAAVSPGDLQLPSMMPMMAELGGTTGLVSDMFAMHVVDLSTPSAPALANTVPLPGGMWPTSAAFDGDTAYVGTITGGMMIVDLTDPYAPSQLSYLSLGGDFEGYLEHFGDAVYAQVGTEIVLIDVSDPALPVEVDRFDAEIEGSLLYALGYVAVAGDGLRMLDVSDPWAPAIVARHDLVGTAQALHLHFANMMLYVRDAATIRVFDLSEPTEPALHGAYPGPVSRFASSFYDLLVISSGNLYLAPEDCGYAIVDDVADVPCATRILGAAPNPFNPSVEVKYGLPRAQFVSVTVHDLRGRTVATLVEGLRGEGVQTAVWRGRRDDGRPATSGSYVVRVRTADAVDSRKVTLLQ